MEVPRSLEEIIKAKSLEANTNQAPNTSASKLKEAQADKEVLSNKNAVLSVQSNNMVESTVQT